MRVRRQQRRAGDAAVTAPDPSWLLPRHADRQRMIDMDRRLRPIRVKALGVLAIALVLSAPWLGIWTLLPLLLAGALFWIAEGLMERISRPEYLIFTAWAGSQVVIAASVIATQDPTSMTLAWLAIPIVTLGARFSVRGVVVGVAMTLVLVAAVPLAIDAGAAVENPSVVIAAMALVIGTALLSTPLMRSDIEHRDEAVLDPLTGMLNRKALTTRVRELEQQSAVNREPVAVITLDLDNFKQVNDTLGHAEGDAVLREVAYVLRKRLRAFDLSYRLGGEEFVVLLPGAELERALELAEGLCSAVREISGFGELSVTASLGVSASRPGERFDFEAVFDEADQALYRAKAEGRDRAFARRPTIPSPEPALEMAPA